ncbi:hypothetical protein VCRA217O317_280033 [Vibrio crassostreae]|nr:hypothetical protein VCRA217O317_280033 [Vibrio crassostreae]
MLMVSTLVLQLIDKALINDLAECFGWNGSLLSQLIQSKSSESRVWILVWYIILRGI